MKRPLAAVLLATTLSSIAPAQDQKAPEKAPPKKYPGDQSGAPLSPADAVKAMTLPKGFSATVFAAEPDISQPINYCIDDRGRLWVAENFSYPKGALTGHDRITILEDTDGDGHFDKKTLFAEGFGYLTSVQVGFGGVYVASAPNLSFIPDRDGDDKPDGPPEVLLDGWTWKGLHNVIDGLTWGPDGWLYGLHGITESSYVGKPGTPDKERTPVNCGVWRFHPKTKTLEYLVEGTCNPWGLDFDERGQGFFTCNVVAHLWQMVPGAHYKRMFGHDFNPYVYGQMDAAVDHLHWAGGDWTKSRGAVGAHGEAGGGHSHAGAMIYLGDALPPQYRGTIFMNNIHGNRINNDRLSRRGSGFVASHNPDFMKANDKWFRGITLQYGPDGSIYSSDWSDSGECHQIHPDITNGRIYRIAYEGTKPVQVDLQKESDESLAKMQLLSNEWYVRHARRILQERGPNPKVHDAMNKILSEDHDEVHQLRALWTLHATGGLDEKKLISLLDRTSEFMRGWAIQLLCETRNPSSAALDKFAAMAQSDSSPLVRLYLAEALQRMPLEARWTLAENLVSHADDNNDPFLPLMYWYGIEPLVPADRARSIKLMNKSKIGVVRQYITRRLAGITSPKAE